MTLTFEILCFHDAEEYEAIEALKMIPTPLLEFETITFKCPDPECGHEVILQIKMDKKELPKY